MLRVLLDQKYRFEGRENLNQWRERERERERPCSCQCQYISRELFGTEEFKEIKERFFVLHEEAEFCLIRNKYLML